MKITIVVLDISISGGIERVASSLANGFSKKYDVEIVSIFGRNKNVFYHLSDKVKVTYLVDQSFKKSNLLTKIKLHYLIIKSLKKHFSKVKKEEKIISMFDNLSIYFSFLKCKNKVIAHQHGQYYAHSKLVRMIRKIRYSKLNCIIALTETDKKKYKQIKKINVYKIPNPLPFKPKKNAKLINKNIIAIGRLVEDKGFDKLISILSNSNFFDFFPQWKVNIYGEGIEKLNIQNLIDSKGLSNNIFLRGLDSQIQDCFLESSLYLCTSRQESFSMTILEAMSLGLPIISYDCPTGPRELIKNNKNGILIENNNEKKYAESLFELLNNFSKMESLGQEAIKFSSNFDLQKIIKSWEEKLTL